MVAPESGGSGRGCSVVRGLLATARVLAQLGANLGTSFFGFEGRSDAGAFGVTKGVSANCGQRFGLHLRAGRGEHGLGGQGDVVSKRREGSEGQSCEDEGFANHMFFQSEEVHSTMRCTYFV